MLGKSGEEELARDDVEVEEEEEVEEVVDEGRASRLE
jgi:hypothetical protein